MKRKAFLILAFASLNYTASHAQVSVAQMDRVASALLQASQVPNLSGQIIADDFRSSGFAAIDWRGTFATIYVHPTALRSETLNTWAFVLGHELSHHILGHRGSGDPQQEFAADELGAAMAVRAGYDVRTYIRRVYANLNSCSATHGCWHDRARNLERKFGYVGGWDSEHEGHTPGRGPFPPVIVLREVYVHYSSSYPHGITFEVEGKRYKFQKGETFRIVLSKERAVLSLWECPPSGCRWRNFQIMAGKDYYVVDSGYGQGLTLSE